MGDPVEKRREKDEKPRKLFSFKAFVFDDGNLAGYGWEYRDMGRMKNQKMSFPAKEEFIAEIRSQIPSALPVVQDVIEAVYNDNGVTDTIETEKIGQVSFDIYSDGMIDTDFAEVMKGSRGAPKAWRRTPNEFIQSLGYSVGALGDTFKPLLGAGNHGGVIDVEGGTVEE